MSVILINKYETDISSDTSHFTTEPLSPFLESYKMASSVTENWADLLDGATIDQTN